MDTTDRNQGREHGFESEASKPKILVIWGDDIGISNLSCYSHGLMGYRTPNIDRIAREGMMFTDRAAKAGFQLHVGCDDMGAFYAARLQVDGEPILLASRALYIDAQFDVLGAPTRRKDILQRVRKFLSGINYELDDVPGTYS